MRAVLLGPFQFPAGFTRTDSPHANDSVEPIPSRFAFDRHVSSLLGLTVPAVVATRKDHGRQWDLFEGSGNYGFVRMVVEVADRDELHALEAGLADIVEPHLVARYGPSVATGSGWECSRILWWHRVLLGEDADLPKALRLFGQEFPATIDRMGRVGDGFTALPSMDQDDVDSVVDGLMVTTEDWLVVDGLSRQMRTTLARSRAGDASLDEVVDQGRELSHAVALSVLLMDERHRGLGSMRQCVHAVASRTWGVDADRAALMEHAAAVNGLIQAEYGRRAAIADRRTNRLLFAFTLVTLLGSVLAFTDFATADRLAFHSWARAVMAAGIGGAAIALIWAYWRSPDS